MGNEQQHKTDDDGLADWLAAYRVADANVALLDRIVAVAASTPQRLKWGFGSWWEEAATLAALALLGFWIGNASLPPLAKNTAMRPAYSAGAVYLDKIIFGPKSWREVNL